MIILHRHHNHWIVLVAILDVRLPQMYVIDSLGGRKKDARKAKLFGDRLMRKRKEDFKDILI